MSTSVLVAKERQPGSSFGLGQKQAKNLWRKRATVARYSMLYRFLCNALQRASQKSKKIRRKCATVARYSMLYRVLNKPKNKKIGRKCATVARYSMLYRFLCNALQRASQKAKKYGANAPQLRPILAGKAWQQVVNPLGTCDNEKTGAIAIEET